MPLEMGPGLLEIRSEGDLPFTAYPFVLLEYLPHAYFIFQKSLLIRIKLYCFIKKREKEQEKAR